MPRVAASERIPSALASAHQASARARAREGKLGGGRKLPLVFPLERALEAQDSARALAGERASASVARALGRKPLPPTCVRHARAVAAPDDADAGAAPAADPNVGDTLDVLKISHGALRIELTTIDVTFLKVLLAVVRPRTETSSPSWSIDNTSAVKAIHLIVSAALLDTRALQFSHIGSALSTWRSTSS